MGAGGYINDFGLGDMGAALAEDPATPDVERARLTEEVAVLPPAIPATTSSSSTRRRSSSRDARAGRTFAQDARGVRPVRLGRRLHRDQRVELRVHRAAGRPGTGQPVRRSDGAGGEARRVLRHPGDSPSRRARTRRHPRDARGAGGPDGPVRHEQPAVAPHPVHVQLRRRAGQDAGDRAGDPAAPLRRRARSARATWATRTTARCRRGTSSARWASTRCRPARPSGRSARRSSPVSRSTPLGGSPIVITAENHQHPYVQDAPGRRQAVAHSIDRRRRPTRRPPHRLRPRP